MRTSDSTEPSWCNVSEQELFGRPLKEISDFVTDENGFPRYLNLVRKGNLAQECLFETVQTFLNEYELPSQEFHLLAYLDLLMLETGLTVSNCKIPEALSQRVSELSSALGIPPSLTYEMIVLNNPVKDTRCFLGGTNRMFERGFYNQHRRIEMHLHRCLTYLVEVLALMNSKADRTDRILELLLKAKEEYSHVQAVMREFFTKYPPQVFAILRPYLGGIRDIPGASGLYSGNHFAVRFILVGERIRGRLEFVLRKLDLFPRELKKLLTTHLELVIPNGDLVTRAKAPHVHAKIREEIINLLSVISKEMGVHQSVVKRVIPDVYRGAKTGTGGQGNAGAFLKEGNKIISDAIVELKNYQEGSRALI